MKSLRSISRYSSHSSVSSAEQISWTVLVLEGSFKHGDPSRHILATRLQVETSIYRFRTLGGVAFDLPGVTTQSSSATMES